VVLADRNKQEVVKNIFVKIKEQTDFGWRFGIQVPDTVMKLLKQFPIDPKTGLKGTGPYDIIVTNL